MAKKEQPDPDDDAPSLEPAKPVRMGHYMDRARVARAERKAKAEREKQWEIESRAFDNAPELPQLNLPHLNPAQPVNPNAPKPPVLNPAQPVNLNAPKPPVLNPAQPVNPNAPKPPVLNPAQPVNPNAPNNAPGGQNNELLAAITTLLKTQTQEIIQSLEKTIKESGGMTT